MCIQNKLLMIQNAFVQLYMPVRIENIVQKWRNKSLIIVLDAIKKRLSGV